MVPGSRWSRTAGTHSEGVQQPLGPGPEELEKISACTICSRYFPAAQSRSFCLWDVTRPNGPASIILAVLACVDLDQTRGQRRKKCRYLQYERCKSGARTREMRNECASEIQAWRGARRSACFLLFVDIGQCSDAVDRSGVALVAPRKTMTTSWLCRLGGSRAERGGRMHRSVRAILGGSSNAKDDCLPFLPAAELPIPPRNCVKARLSSRSRRALDTPSLVGRAGVEPATY